ncbi:hypothetical protein CLU79DRAFT_508378 [Phycomyces nitens]|nr:hypothetical protein CLU79DRAFT_508378 [Phycomyces nitens]
MTLSAALKESLDSHRSLYLPYSQGSPTPSPDNNLIANRKIKNPVRRLNKEPSSVRSTPSFGSMEPPQMNNPSQPAPSFAFGFGGSAFGTPPASNPFQQTSNTPPPSTLFSPTNTFTPPTGKPDGPSPVVFNFGNSPFTPTGSQQDKPISAGLQSPTMFPTVTQQTPQVTMTAEKTGDNGHIDLSSAESRKRKDTSQSFQRTDSRMRHGPSPLSQSSFVPTQGSTVPGAKDTEERLRSTPSSTQPATTNTPTTPITTTTATDTNTSTLFGSEAIKAPKISFDSFGSTSNTLPKTTELPSTPSPTVQPDAPKVSFWTPKNDTPPKTDNIDGKDQETPVPSLKDVFKPGPVNLWNVTKDTKLPGVPVFGKTPSRESGSS